MTKDAERAYLEKIGENGRDHARNKPFSNGDCGLTLCSIGTVISLMPPRPAKILDLGCGTGWTSIFLARHGYTVVGQDISADMIEEANALKRENGVGDNLSFVVGDFEDAGFDAEFDCVLFFDCLHHADDEAKAIRFAAAALKPGGIMITHEPGEGHAANPHSVRAMEDFGVNERDMPPALIMRHAQAAGFADFSIFPMQREILSRFYRAPPPRRLFSTAGVRRAYELLRWVFFRSDMAEAIVVSRKAN